MGSSVTDAIKYSFCERSEFLMQVTINNRCGQSKRYQPLCLQNMYALFSIVKDGFDQTSLL